MNMENRNKEQLIQITAGQGPAECCWVVAQVLKLFLAEGRSAGLTCRVLDRITGPENSTLMSATVLLQGENIQPFIQSWIGSVLWVGQSPYRSFHKRKNWFVGVQQLDAPGVNDVLHERDIRYEATRAGGPGGQHVNKVSTAVRATHIPTGLSVLVSDSRSQLQNKKAAFVRLQEMVNKQNLKQLQDNIQKGWIQHRELERGNPVRVFRGTDFKPQHYPGRERDKRAAQKMVWQKSLQQNEQ